MKRKGSTIGAIFFVLCLILGYFALNASGPRRTKSTSQTDYRSSEVSGLASVSEQIYVLASATVLPGVDTANVMVTSGGTVAPYNKEQIVANKSIVFPNAAVYEGSTKDNLPDGNGKCVWQDCSTYNGNWVSGVINGAGTYTWVNGNTYKGDFTKGQISGKGKYTVKNGPIFEGTFRNGRFIEGTITYMDKNGNKLTETAKNSVLGDFAEIIMNDGTKATVPLTKGAFTGNNAIIYYHNGDNYQGSLLNGLKSGMGTYTWKAGNHYVGMFSFDYFHGQGIYYYTKNENGERLIGDFAFGQPNGTVSYYKNNQKYTTIWANGRCTSISQSRNQTQTPITGEQYIGDKSTSVFHHTWCDSITNIPEQNRKIFKTREDAVKSFYSPCQYCKP